MRWRFVDKITAVHPWQKITGIKSIGLEEYYLLEPLGREYVLPESLVIECCVELARWLVTVSSSFSLTALLRGVDGFHFAGPAEGGEVLEICANLVNRDGSGVTVDCSVAAQGRAVAHGRLDLGSFRPLDISERDEMTGRWRELHGPA
jgi:3-hydroxymyristoyl/3-hydroxydecanoyl-(acyl carrier protein) dehydratase